MDPVIIAALSLLAGMAYWRLRRTYRSARRNKGPDIQKELAALRKKRDEDEDEPIV